MAINHLEAPAHGWNPGGFDERVNRSPMDQLSRWGIGLLSLFAKLTGGASGGSAEGQARAAGESVGAQPLAPYCCDLANPNGPFCPHSGPKYDYTCPPGYQKMWWYCCYGTKVLGCGECTKANTCWIGPWPCSIWWDVPGAKC
jgi:hypothetical protein